MGFEELTEKSKKFFVPILSVVILILVAIAARSALRNYRESTSGSVAAKAFYTSDGGATYFTDAANLPVPLVREGKTIVRAQVVRCGSDNPVVHFLARYTPEALAQLKSLRSDSQDAFARVRIERDGTELASPNTTAWFPVQSPEGAAIANLPRCPAGSSAVVVDPE